MGNAPRCPRCGSSNTRKSDDRLIKGRLSFLGDIALGFGLGKLGMSDFAVDNAEDLTLSQFVDDEFLCKGCGCVWKSGQKPTRVSQNQHQQRVEPNVASFHEKDDFGTDWDLFWDQVDTYLTSRQNFENEYNNICRKARKQTYANPNASASYYYMASVLCYFFK